MAREYVDSSSIRWFEFDSGRWTLDVAFDSGGIYRYTGVTPAVCERLRTAESKGRFVNEIIKKRYPYAVLRRP
jgi:hypothetical protein